MKILVACEESGAVRDAFRELGHDAWSCDLLPSATPSLYHYQQNVLDLLDGMPLGTYYGERFCDLSRGDQEKVNYLDIPEDVAPWDMMIAFPPCTHLAVSGAAWFEAKRADGRQQAGIDFFMSLANAPIPKIAIENPVGIMSKIWRKPDQIIQPYYFGDEFQKTTCLWLKGLPKLRHAPTTDLFQEQTHVGRGEMITFPSGKRMAKWYALLRADAQRGHLRSKTFPGIARAMATQWGTLNLN